MWLQINAKHKVFVNYIYTEFLYKISKYKKLT